MFITEIVATLMGDLDRWPFEGYPYQLSGRTAYLSAIVGNRLLLLQSIAYIFFDGIINNAGE